MLRAPERSCGAGPGLPRLANGTLGATPGLKWEGREQPAPLAALWQDWPEAAEEAGLRSSAAPGQGRQPPPLGLPRHRAGRVSGAQSRGLPGKKRRFCAERGRTCESGGCSSSSRLGHNSGDRGGHSAIPAALLRRGKLGPPRSDARWHPGPLRTPPEIDQTTSTINKAACAYDVIKRSRFPGLSRDSVGSDLEVAKRPGSSGAAARQRCPALLNSGESVVGLPSFEPHLPYPSQSPTRRSLI